MKRVLLVMVLLSLMLAACGSAGDVPVDMPQALQVTDGTQETSYTVADLEKLGASEADFNGVTYKGVTLTILLADAGFDAGSLKAVKATAADGYSMNYDPSLIQRQDVLVAYATAGGSLSEEDGTFRMVLPGEEGKLNVRMLSELTVIP